MAMPTAADFKGTPFADLPIVDEPWNPDGKTDSELQDEILGGADGSNWARYEKAHLAYAPGSDFGGDPPTQRDAYKLKVARMRDGALTVFWTQLVSRVGILNGARGGVDINRVAKNAAWSHAMRYYDKFGKDEKPDKKFSAALDAGELKLGKVDLAANLEPSTFNESDRTVEMVFYSGETVPYWTWDLGEHMLSFSLEPAAIRMGRIASGRAPIKAGHMPNSEIEAVYGVIDRGWLAADGLHALGRFSEREDVQPYFDDVKAGILRNVSMEARIHQLEDRTQPGDLVPHVHAIDWEPMAVALVAIGNAESARTLAQGEERNACTIVRAQAPPARKKGEAMKIKVRLLADIDEVGKLDEIVEIEESEFDASLHSRELEAKPSKGKGDPPGVVPDDLSEDRKLAAFKASEDKRAGRIRELQIHFGEDDLWAQRHISLGSTVDTAAADGQRRAAKKAPDIEGRLPLGADYEAIGWKSQRIVEALSARAAGEKCPEHAKKWERSTIAECAFVVLEHRGETRGRALDPLRHPEDVIKLAMGTTDFPGILANVLNKTLLPPYMAAAPSFRAIAARRDFRDYRAHKFVRLGDFPETKLVGEGGEVTEGSIGESSESVTCLKYGRILNLLWEVLVNDDLGAFTDFGGAVARRVIDRERALFYATCITAASGLGPNLADGVAVHNSAHANVCSAGALSNTRLNEAFGLMAAQTGISGDSSDSEVKLDIAPRYLLTSPTSAVLGRTLLTAVNPTQASEINPWAGIIEPVYDSNMTGTRYYVIADPMMIPNYIYGTVSGQGPRFEVRQGFEVEGVQVKVVHDFGCGAIDYRGTTTGAGA